jgi:hypothetical protein
MIFGLHQNGDPGQEGRYSFAYLHKTGELQDEMRDKG